MTMQLMANHRYNPYHLEWVLVEERVLKEGGAKKVDEENIVLDIML